jgi:hypothetical protein
MLNKNRIRGNDIGILQLNNNENNRLFNDLNDQFT